MLVLQRKAQERVLIGDNIVITVMDIRRGAVRIGIEAPKDLRIAREEVAALLAGMEAETDSASGSILGDG